MITWVGGGLRLPRRSGEVTLVAAALVCVALVIAMPVLNGTHAVELTCLHWLLSGAVAVIGALLARSAATSLTDRRGWGLLVIGNLLWLAAVAIYDVYMLTGSFPPSPTASDLMWLGAGIVSAAGCRHLLGARTRRHDLSWLELAPLGVAVSVLLLVLLWPDITASAYSTAAVVTTLAYPIVYVSTATIMLQALVSGSLQLRRNWGMGAVLLGLVVEAVTFVAWAPPLLDGTYVAGHSHLDPLWTIGMTLIGVGAWRAQPVQATPDLSSAGARGGVLPTVSFLLLAAVQIVVTGRDGRLSALSIGVGLTGMLLAFRGSILRRSNDLLQRDSRTDPLMGIANRLQLSEDLQAADTRAQQTDHRYAVALFDLDHFKAYNDLLGHQAGDLALQSVAMLLHRSSRSIDRIYRYGGEELILLIHGVDITLAEQIVERHRQALEQARLTHPGNEPFGVITVSVGVACLLPDETPQQVTQRADEALYRAKAEGRNRTVAAGPTRDSSR